MKSKIRFVLIVIIFFISFVSSFTNSSAKGSAFTSLVKSSQEMMDHYTYERAFKDGIWWIYVYDGTELVDVYPE